MTVQSSVDRTATITNYSHSGDVVLVTALATSHCKKTLIGRGCWEVTSIHVSHGEECSRLASADVVGWLRHRLLTVASVA